MRLVLTWNLSSIARLGIENQISSVVSPANDPWFQLEMWCAEFSMCSVVKLLAPHCRKCHLKPDKWEYKKMYSCVKYTEAPWATTWKVWKQHYSCRLRQFPCCALVPSWSELWGLWYCCSWWSASNGPSLLVRLSAHLTPKHMSVSEHVGTY